MEPYETVVIDVDDEYSGTVVEKMAAPQGRDDRHAPLGRRQDPPHLLAPSRGLIGYHGEFLSDTRGTGIMNRLFDSYGPYKGPIAGPPERRADLAWSRARPVPMRSTCWKNAACCSSRRARSSTKA